MPALPWTPAVRAGAPALEKPTFRLISDLLRAHSGIRFGDELLPKVERRLRARLFAVNARSFEEYYRHLKYRDHARREIAAAVELLTVHETYFFRELNQLEVFRDKILPDILKRKRKLGQRTLKIWSAGCSTGEETYSIAMLVDGHPIFRNWDIQIIGTDISKGAVQAANEGLYSESSFRAMPREFYAFFDAVGATHFRVRDKYRHMCRFFQHNLFDEERRLFLSGFDVVFCRNVLIYFDLERRTRAVRKFYRSLRPGGFLLLGHSESLLNTSEQFQVASLQHALTYQKPPLPSSSRPPSHESGRLKAQ